jgi:hypothetical protein
MCRRVIANLSLAYLHTELEPLKFVNPSGALVLGNMGT